MNPLQHSCKHTNTVSSTCTANSLHAGLIKLGSKKAFVPPNLIPLLFDSLFNSRIWMSAIYGLTATSVWVFSHSILQPFYAGHNPSYLLDVALDELGGGHLLSRQTLFQLKFVWWGERLAPFCPAGTTMGGERTMSSSILAGQPTGPTLALHGGSQEFTHMQTHSDGESNCSHKTATDDSQTQALNP